MSESKNNSNTTKKLGDYFRPYFSPKLVYDDIVDRSNFRSTAEIKRDMRASGKIGAGEKPIYDYQPGEKIEASKVVSELELLLRAGKLDKADIQKLREVFEADAKDSVESAKEAEKLKAQEEAQTNREKAIDEALGVNQSE